MEKKICDLTDKEIRRIVSDIASPKKITNIKRHKREDLITCTIYTKWECDNDDGTPEYSIERDEVEIRNPFDSGREALYSEYPFDSSDVHKLEQFCIANGIYPEDMVNNPYLREGQMITRAPGHWIVHADHYTCSSCGEDVWADASGYKYCPYCGALMEEEGK